MGSRRNNLIVLALVVVLLGVAAYFIFIDQPVTESTQLGLDLQGGVSAQLKGSQTGGGKVTRQEMEQSADLIRQRIDRLGVTEPDVRVQSENQIVVQIPGVKKPEEVIRIIGSTAQLGFYQVLAPDPSLTEPPQVVAAGEVDATEEDIRKNLKDDDAYVESKTKILFSETPSLQGDGIEVIGYIVHKNPDLTGDALKQNGANVEFDQTTGKRIVSLELTAEGGRQMADLTQKMVNDSLASGEPARLAIALDEDIQSAPTVQEPLGQNISISNDGLPNGLPEDEAKQLETVLNTGALPVNMEVISETTVGPTLGLSSLKSGLLASLVGFGLVLLLLLVIYRALGIVADLALLIYAFLLWGLIVIIPITVTLPGIAGIVLSIGVAADANVVIFERIKEEIRRGKTPRSAIQAGYDKGYRAILDGNITTLITAFILFALSSGSVRGFAVLLDLSRFAACRGSRHSVGWPQLRDRLPGWGAVHRCQRRAPAQRRAGARCAARGPGRGIRSHDYGAERLRGADSGHKLSAGAKPGTRLPEPGVRGGGKRHDREPRVRPAAQEPGAAGRGGRAAHNRGLYQLSVRVCLRPRCDGRARSRHTYDGRFLRHRRQGGQPGNRRRCAHGARVLDLRHHNHLRQDQGERPYCRLQQAPLRRDDKPLHPPGREAFYLHLYLHPDPDNGAVDLRGSDPERLRLRPSCRYRRRDLQLHLHRITGTFALQGLARREAPGRTLHVAAWSHDLRLRYHVGG